jgi:ERO1-like protein alpha
MSSCYFREQDFCYIEDDATQGRSAIVAALMVDGQYIDLSLNPERFTGYAGDSAHHVWRAIYEENCFGLSEASMGGDISIGFNKLSEGLGTEMVRAGGEMCEEKKVYYRVISGRFGLRS